MSPKGEERKVPLWLFHSSSISAEDSGPVSCVERIREVSRVASGCRPRTSHASTVSMPALRSPVGMGSSELEE